MKERTYSFDFIRILACILVVTVHVAAISFITYSPTSFQWSVSNLYDCMGIIGVPLFFMLSGALLLNPAKKFSYKYFFFHNFVKILLAYIFTVILYNMEFFLFEASNHSVSIFVDEVVKNTMRLQGHNLGHTWFLPALLTLYLVTPLLRKAFADEKVCAYFIILFLFFGIILYTLSLLGIKYYDAFEELYKKFTVDLFLNYTGYFCLGHYLANFERKRSKYYPIFAASLAFVGFVFTVMANQLVTNRTGSSSVLYNTPFAIGHFASAYGLFALFLVIFKNHKPSGSICRFLTKLTFPIYLLHPMIILFLKGIHYPFFFTTPIIAIPVTVIVVFVLTSIVSFLWNLLYGAIRKIPVLRHFE